MDGGQEPGQGPPPREPAARHEDGHVEGAAQSVLSGSKGESHIWNRRWSLRASG